MTSGNKRVAVLRVVIRIVLLPLPRHRLVNLIHHHRVTVTRRRIKRRRKRNQGAMSPHRERKKNWKKMNVSKTLSSNCSHCDQPNQIKKTTITTGQESLIMLNSIAAGQERTGIATGHEVKKTNIVTKGMVTTRRGIRETRGTEAGQGRTGIVTESIDPEVERIDIGRTINSDRKEVS